MKTVTFNIETSWAHGGYSDTFEVEDDATDAEIEECVNDLIPNYVSWGWSCGE